MHNEIQSNEYSSHEPSHATSTQWRSRTQQRLSCPLWPIILPGWPLAWLLTLGISFDCLVTSQKWNHTIYIHFCLTSFTQHQTEEIHPSYVLLWFIFSHDCVVFHLKNAIQLLLDVWEFTSNLGYDRKCYYGHSYTVHTFWWTYVHIFLGPWLGVELLSHKFLKCSVLVGTAQ